MASLLMPCGLRRFGRPTWRRRHSRPGARGDRGVRLTARIRLGSVSDRNPSNRANAAAFDYSQYARKAVICNSRRRRGWSQVLGHARRRPEARSPRFLHGTRRRPPGGGSRALAHVVRNRVEATSRKRYSASFSRLTGSRCIPHFSIAAIASFRRSAKPAILSGVKTFSGGGGSGAGPIGRNVILIRCPRREDDRDHKSRHLWVSWNGIPNPGALGDCLGECLEVAVAPLHRSGVPADRAIGRFEREHGLLGVLGERHAVAVVLEGGEAVRIL